VHDLQIFADMEAFKSHADTTIPAVAYGFGGMFDGYDMKGKVRPAISGIAWSD
jgi:hypothetical protein